jgi:hypothetical protein
MKDKRYKIKLNKKTTVEVLEHQLYHDRWIKHFGSVEKVEKFIKENN